MTQKYGNSSLFQILFLSLIYILVFTNIVFSYFVRILWIKKRKVWQIKPQMNEWELKTRGNSFLGSCYLKKKNSKEGNRCLIWYTPFRVVCTAVEICNYIFFTSIIIFANIIKSLFINSWWKTGDPFFIRKSASAFIWSFRAKLSWFGYFVDISGLVSKKDYLRWSAYRVGINIGKYLKNKFKSKRDTKYCNKLQKYWKRLSNTYQNENHQFLFRII